jgi:2-keto-4-pentenoate hydratase/2-oxohepta-3-ene-1,7-dioic acid hydratase in catechol pathway
MMKQIDVAGETFTPTKIVCIGRNYVDHIRELDNEVPERPVIFIKPNSAIRGQPCCQADEELHYEGEITFMVRAGQIAAVGFGLDLTRRRLQGELKAKGLPWERAKAFDGAAVFSGFVPFSGDTSGLRLELHINNRLVQAGGHALMMTKPAALLAEVKRDFTLEDGDLIMTGTPAGVGPLLRGDRFLGRVFNGDRLLVEGHWQVQ